MIALIEDSNDCIVIKGANINTVMSDGIDELFMEEVQFNNIGDGPAPQHGSRGDGYFEYLRACSDDSIFVTE